MTDWASQPTDLLRSLHACPSMIRTDGKPLPNHALYRENPKSHHAFLKYKT